MAALLLLALGLLAFPRELCPPVGTCPVSDYAKIELYTRLASEGAQRVGTESRFHFHHPGPSFFYFAVPFYRLLGQRSEGLGLAALAWNLLALIVMVRCAGRLAPPAGPFLMLAVMAWYIHSRGLCWLLSSWNPNTALFPFGVALLASAILATGEGWALALWVLSASAAVQSHIVWALPVGMSGAAGLLLGCWPRARRALGVPSAGPGPGRAALFAALVAAALMWALPVYDEFSSEYRNFHRILAGNPSRPEARPWPEVASAVVRGLLPTQIGLHEEPSPSVPPEPKPTTPEALASLLLIGALVLGGALAARRRSALAALAWVLGLMAVFLAAAEAAARAPRLAARAAGPLGALVLLLVSALLLADNLRPWRVAGPPPRSASSDQVEHLATQIRQQLPLRTPTWVLVRVSPEAEPGIALGLILALDKAKLRLRVEPFGSCRLVGHFTPRGDETSELLIGELAASGAVLLARAGDLNVYWRPAAMIRRYRPPLRPAAGGES
jgi:hypothetical protein